MYKFFLEFSSFLRYFDAVGGGWFECVIPTIFLLKIFWLVRFFEVNVGDWSKFKTEMRLLLLFHTIQCTEEFYFAQDFDK